MANAFARHVGSVVRNRPKGMSVKDAFRKAASEWHRMHGRGKGSNPKSNPVGIDLGQVILIGGGAFVVDQALLGGQITNSIMGLFKGPEPPPNGQP